MTSLSLCHAPRPAGATRAAGRHRKPVLQAQLRLATEDDRPALLELHRCALLALVRMRKRHLPRKPGLSPV